VVDFQPPEFADPHTRALYLGLRRAMPRLAPHARLHTRLNAAERSLYWLCDTTRKAPLPRTLPKVARGVRWYRLQSFTDPSQRRWFHPLLIHLGAPPQTVAHRIVFEAAVWPTKSPVGLQFRAEHTAPGPKATKTEQALHLVAPDGQGSIRLSAEDVPRFVALLGRAAQSAAALRDLARAHAAASAFVVEHATDLHWLLVQHLPLDALFAHAGLPKLEPPPEPPGWAYVPPPPPPVPRGADDTVHCPRCGSRGGWRKGSDVLHGNPYTPASDSEVEHHYTCVDTTCGHAWTCIV